MSHIVGASRRWVGKGLVGKGLNVRKGMNFRKDTGTSLAEIFFSAQWENLQFLGQFGPINK
jgi:hypothetical protein